MSRLARLTPVFLVSLALPLSAAHADAVDDLSRRAYRVGVAALDAVDATPAQRRAVAAAARDLGHRLAPFETDLRGWVRSVRDTWLSDRVERAEVEAVRVEGVALVDDQSAETVDFVVDTASALTPEQRHALVRWARKQAEQRLLD